MGVVSLHAATSNRREHHRMSEKERSLFCTPCEPKLQCLACVRLFYGRERVFASAPMKESAGPSDPSHFLPALSSPRHLHGAMGAAQGQPARFRHKGRRSRALSTHLAVQRAEASSAICRRMRCTPATMGPSASYEPARQHHAIPRPRRATPPRNSCGSARPPPSRSTTQRSRGPPTKPPSSAS